MALPIFLFKIPPFFMRLCHFDAGEISTLFVIRLEISPCGRNDRFWNANYFTKNFFSNRPQVSPRYGAYLCERRLTTQYETNV